uniref:Uncharacterized protein n=1 Tax=Cyclopterus lumpus TaxID=8103 RepID=A0A8C2X8B5_CYCLU
MVLSSQGGHHHVPQLYLEIIGVHAQFLRVQHAQLGVGVLQVVHWISHDCSGVVEVSKVTEIPLSPGVDDQTPSCRAHCLIVHLGEDVLDGGALEVCPLNHCAGSRLSCALPSQKHVIGWAVGRPSSV